MTKPIDNSGPAFPMQDSQAIHDYASAAMAHVEDYDERDRVYLEARREAICGLTVRQYFAARAPIGWEQVVAIQKHRRIADGGSDGGIAVSNALHAELCFAWADAMIAAGAQPPKEV